MTDVPEFQAPRLKVERAKRHIAELNREVVAFLERKPYRVVVEPDAEPWLQNWVIRVRADEPDHLAPIIGDAVHNLRATLDLLACAAVAHAGESVKGVYFPFAESAQELERRIADKKIGRAGAAIVDLIRALKPYKGGNDTLRAIHDLDVTDKHIAIIPTAYLAGFTGQLTRGKTVMATVNNMRVGPLRDGQIAFSLSSMDSEKLGAEVEAAFEIAFGEGQPIEGTPVLPWLEEAQQLVARIIEEFETRCVRPA